MGTGAASAEPVARKPVRNIAGFTLDAQKVRGGLLLLEGGVLGKRAGDQLFGVYTICVDESGSVYDVKAVESIPNADAEVIAAMRTWAYQPQSSRVCGTKRYFATVR